MRPRDKPALILYCLLSLTSEMNLKPTSSRNDAQAGVCEARSCRHVSTPALPGIDVPSYVAFLSQGDYEKAIDVIRERNPFPAVS